MCLWVVEFESLHSPPGIYRRRHKLLMGHTSWVMLSDGGNFEHQALRNSFPAFWEGILGDSVVKIGMIMSKKPLISIYSCTWSKDFYVGEGTSPHLNAPSGLGITFWLRIKTLFSVIRTILFCVISKHSNIYPIGWMPIGIVVALFRTFVPTSSAPWILSGGSRIVAG